MTADMFPEVLSVPPDEPEPPPEGYTPNWFTPLEDFFAWEDKLLSLGIITGLFNLDPCGHEEAPVSQEILRRGGIVYTANEDGLQQSWTGSRPYFNPPFKAELMAAFLARFHYFRNQGLVIEGSLHGPAWMDRAWAQDHIEPDRRAGRCLVEFVRGRILYGYPGNPTGKGGGTFPSMWVAWGGR